MYLKKIHQYRGVTFTTLESNSVLAEKHQVPIDMIQKYGALFIVITQGVQYAMPIDQYPCIVLPQNLARFGFTEDEIKQLLLHELGHLCVPGALDYELRQSSVEKEMRADLFTTRPDAMITALKKLKALYIKCAGEYLFSKEEIRAMEKDIDARIYSLRKRCNY